MQHGHDQHHGHDHHHGRKDGPVEFTREFWDERYRSAGQLWSGRPNVQLAAQVAELAPGDALEAGCGEGADAIWLAGLGWRVTAVDVSAVALERGAAEAAARGDDVAARISWCQADLISWDPGPERFDLVSAQFMYLPGDALAALHRRLARAVRPGGTLLVVGHHPDDLPPNAAMRRLEDPGMARTAGQLAAALDPGEWETHVSETIGRPPPSRDGEPPAIMRDTILRAVRRR